MPRREDPFARAFAEARAAAARGEVPVGAAVARDGAVLSAAGNRTLADRDPTAHAELLAVRAACAALGTERLTGCDLYVTLEPCAMCAGALSLARIRRLYYAAPDPKGGAVDHGARVFAQPTCHHAPDVYGGLREAEAAALLRGFFRERRRARTPEGVAALPGAAGEAEMAGTNGPTSVGGTTDTPNPEGGAVEKPEAGADKAKDAGPQGDGASGDQNEDG